MFNIGGRRPAAPRRASARRSRPSPPGPGAGVRDPPRCRSRSACCSARLWGFIPGFLKARTGAHEVITTIMLNYVAAQIVFFALRSDDAAAARQHGRRSRSRSSAFVDMSADHQPARRSASTTASSSPLLMAAVGLVPAVPDDKGLRAPRLRVQPDGRALRGHERRRLDDARDGPVRRTGRPRRLVPGHRAPWASCRSTSPGASGSTPSRSPCWPGCGPGASCSRRSCSAR